MSDVFIADPQGHWHRVDSAGGFDIQRSSAPQVPAPGHWIFADAEAVSTVSASLSATDGVSAHGTPVPPGVRIRAVVGGRLLCATVNGRPMVFCTDDSGTLGLIVSVDTLGVGPIVLVADGTSTSTPSSKAVWGVYSPAADTSAPACLGPAGLSCRLPDGGITAGLCLVVTLWDGATQLFVASNGSVSLSAPTASDLVLQDPQGYVQSVNSKNGLLLLRAVPPATPPPGLTAAWTITSPPATFRLDGGRMPSAAFKVLARSCDQAAVVATYGRIMTLTASGLGVSVDPGTALVRISYKGVADVWSATSLPSLPGYTASLDSSVLVLTGEAPSKDVLRVSMDGSVAFPERSWFAKVTAWCRKRRAQPSSSPTEPLSASC